MSRHDAVNIRSLQLTGETALDGMAYEIKPVTRIHRVPEALIGPDSPEGIAVSHRVDLMH